MTTIHVEKGVLQKHSTTNTHGGNGDNACSTTRIGGSSTSGHAGTADKGLDPVELVLEWVLLRHLGELVFQVWILPES